MSVTCTKDFQITLADPSLVAFWKLDEASGTTRADSTPNGNTLSAILGAPSSVAGKISNAMRIPNDGTLMRANLTPVWVNQSVTAAGWIRSSALIVGSESQFSFNGNSLGAEEWSIYIIPKDTGADRNFYAGFFNEVGPVTVEVDSGTIFSLSTFHFFVLELDIPNLTLGISINNSSMVTVAIPAAPVAGVSSGFNSRNTETQNVRDLDELGIWYRKLTSDERAFLYNSGAGRTYPDVPSGP